MWLASIHRRKFSVAVHLTRQLHARAVKGTCSILRPEATRFSPALGLILSNAPGIAGNLLQWARHESPVSQRPLPVLARELFHQSVPEEPVRPTRNLSLPGAHLTPRLIGHMLGLAHVGASWERIEETLRGEGIAALAKDTRVTISRFGRLVQLVQQCQQDRWEEPQGSTVLTKDGPTWLLLRLLWEKAESKGDLLDSLTALHEHVPVFQDERLAHDEAIRQAWTRDLFDCKSLDYRKASRSVLQGRDGPSWASSAEVVAFGLGRES